uniref:Uncharacterized protein n=1 Tax=Pipistrellus kuhlii TaxID=59472 RepID=A0A7J7RDW5_PIPKU|nr:hypothetical protein mPipKuh1_010566 [Pipistrellus kuhlii]
MAAAGSTLAPVSSATAYGAGRSLGGRLTLPVSLLSGEDTWSAEGASSAGRGARSKTSNEPPGLMSLRDDKGTAIAVLSLQSQLQERLFHSVPFADVHRLHCPPGGLRADSVAPPRASGGVGP